MASALPPVIAEMRSRSHLAGKAGIKASALSSLLLLAFALPVEAANDDPDIPRVVTGYALQLDAECSADSDPGAASGKVALPSQSSSKMIEAAASGPNGQIFVVDGALTACGDTGPLCGTGGCPIGLFRVKDGVTTNYYDAQALGWKITGAGSKAIIRVHGSLCGGFGPDPCAIEIDLVSGKRRTFRPAD